MLKAVACLLFVVLMATLVGSSTPVGGSKSASRWKRVDLSQYCGKTVGELIDALGHDYAKYELLRESRCLYFGYADSGCADVAIFLYPTKEAYRNGNLWQDVPGLEDVMREHISNIVLRTGR